MSQRYCCTNADRRADLVAAGFVTHDLLTLNAIDYLEVVDGVLDEEFTPADDPRQYLLLVRFFLPAGLASLDRSHVQITGGTTIRAVRARFVWQLGGPAPVGLGLWSPVAATWLAGRAVALGGDAGNWLVVVVDQRGDHAQYRFKLVSSVGSTLAPAGFDAALTEVPFAFKVECATEFDCEDTVDCAPDDAPAPQLDYLARDYQSFRRLMVDRLSVLLPDWRERNPADLGVTIVELLAYSADRAAYFQDAVATEAYLDTARLRTSVRRHARLLDYRMHEGCNARAFVQLVMETGQVVSGGAVQVGDRFLTDVPDAGPVIRSADAGAALRPTPVPGGVRPAPEVFEALHTVDTLTWRHNEIHLHTWGETRCIMASGTTSAVLRTPDGAGSLALAVGDVIVFEEARHPETGATADASPQRRHAVRLTAVGGESIDPLYGTRTVEVDWDEADALPFSFCLWQIAVNDVPVPVTVVRGNIVLVDHGATRSDESLVPETVPTDGRYRPRLRGEDLTFANAYDVKASATDLLVQDPRTAQASVELADGDDTWTPLPELLGSDPFDRSFVVEMESDGRAWIRFGDGVLGRRPTPGVSFAATYRTGRGTRGNVGAETIRHVVSDALAGAVLAVRNPMPARGGVDAESMRTVKLEAPEAFKVQMRAVTAEDWAEIAGRHPAVQRAVATLRWTGSWHTVFLTVDPFGARDLDPELEAELRAFLEQFRLAGIDLELRPPAYVPLDLRFVLCVKPDHFAHEVKSAALEALSSRVNSDGRQGWFHPDRMSFGEHVYLSPIIARLMEVPGVAWVDLDPVANGTDAVRFQRIDRPPAGELTAGMIPVGRLEVARLDNDPSAPDNGRVRITTRGGR
jgi:hypothetical protein